MCGVQVCYCFIDLDVAIQLSPHHLLKEMVFSALYNLSSFVEDWLMCVGSFPDSLLFSTDPYICFSANTMLFWLL